MYVEAMPRLVIVSAHAHAPFTPRGERTRALAEGLAGDWEVEVIAPPPAGSGASSGATAPAPVRAARTAARLAVETTLLDKWEPWSARRVGPRWSPRADAALLIAYPFSPAIHAGRRLARAGIPYVVDSGDPWNLTAARPTNRPPGLLRARRAEHRLWREAAGAVLTTAQQAADLEALFGDLSILVRPNGYPVEAAEAADWRPREPAGRHLRLAHFGMLSAARLDVLPLLRGLAADPRWERITFAQYGDDFVGMLRDAPAGVEVELHRPRPWEAVVAAAGEYDAVVVVGNHSATQLPSKAVQYLTLPVPRLAVSNGAQDDAMATFARRMPGWLAVRHDDPEAATAVAAHLERRWTPDELRPPAEEGWPAVAATVAAFLRRCTGREGAAHEPALRGLR